MGSVGSKLKFDYEDDSDNSDANSVIELAAQVQEEESPTKMSKILEAEPAIPDIADIQSTENSISVFSTS